MRVAHRRLLGVALVLVRPAPGRPYGFRDFGQFREFATRFRDRMRELYPDLDMGFQGSSVTGRSAGWAGSLQGGEMISAEPVRTQPDDPACGPRGQR